MEIAEYGMIEGYHMLLGQLWLIERALEVKLPTIWTDEAAEAGRVREDKRRRSEKRKSQRKEDQMVPEMVEKLRNCVFQFFQCFVALRVQELQKIDMG